VGRAKPELKSASMTARLDPATLRARMDPANLRAALWAIRALRRTRRDLARHGLEGARVSPPPPALPAHARRGVLAVIKRRPNTCLERALVLQRWEAAHGAAADVVIGVPGRGDDFVAHAWLETMPDAQVSAYHELMRIPARAE
jgi:transglutaminase superfamily protein